MSSNSHELNKNTEASQRGARASADSVISSGKTVKFYYQLQLF